MILVVDDYLDSCEMLVRLPYRPTTLQALYILFLLI